MPTTTSSSTMYNDYYGPIALAITGYVISQLIFWAYQIRMQSIHEYGPVIHEFDPYFNWRATEYLYYNGAKKFFTWFDYKVWYPLGRPVGTTIYPGMQFTAVWINRYLLPHWSLNDVCCYMPAWFGAIASCLTGLLAYECSLPQNTKYTIFGFLVDIVKGRISEPPIPVKRHIMLGLTSPSLFCGVFAMAFMSIVPAHLMRSVGGGYDNESVAISAMCLTFYLWVRSLRSDEKYSWLFGIPAGMAYFYMVAAWGGYVFVLNMIGVHAAALVALGRFSNKVYAAYSLFYIVGTSLAIQIPVVGWAPLKSLEQLAPCAVFLGYQVLQFCEVVRKKKQLSRTEAWKLRINISAACLVALILAVYIMAPSGYFGPISSRVRGLFVQHTKTGNPLVDSVAEHQPASNRAYFQYLHHVCSLAPLGYLLVFGHLSDSSSFLLAWGTAAYFFSHKMVRLILLTAPVGSAFGGIFAGHVFAWCLGQLLSFLGPSAVQKEEQDHVNGSGGAGVNGSSTPTTTTGKATTTAKTVKTGGKGGKETRGGASEESNGKPVKDPRKKKAKKATSSSSTANPFQGVLDSVNVLLDSKEGVMVKRVVAVVILFLFWSVGVNFKNYCWRLSLSLSNPTIIQKAQTRTGQVVLVDDYREAYWWLRDNTPEDARVLAWWDYGYQITGIANRTTIADGNTWNHEHIALLGKCLTSSEEEGYEIARHLADYVLVWGGGGGDDLAKSPHLARIANSVYRDHCPDDPTCRRFGFIDRQGTPSPMMQRSLLYRLHGHQVKPNVVADPAKWEEVFRSKYGKVRIYKVLGVSEESKAWVADPANRVCDVLGSWFCPGQYPPGLANILASKKDFSQLEDFNRGLSDEEYQKAYFEALQNPDKYKQKARQLDRDEFEKQYALSQEEGGPHLSRPDEIYNTWEDTEDTTMMWKLISTNAVDELQDWIEDEPTIAFIRSKDGRGPMWWAFESRNQDIVKLLMKAGVPHTDRDAQGKTPVDLLQGPSN